MPQGDKGAYTSKQKRQARHIEDSERRRGRSSRGAARIAWATVNKQDGGGKRKRSRTGRTGSRTASTRRRTARPASRPAAARTGARRTAGRKRTRTVRARA